MIWNKKAKLITTVSVCSAVIAVPLVIALPVVMSNENKQTDYLNQVKQDLINNPLTFDSKKSIFNNFGSTTPFVNGSQNQSSNELNYIYLTKIINPISDFVLTNSKLNLIENSNNVNFILLNPIKFSKDFFFKYLANKKANINNKEININNILFSQSSDVFNSGYATFDQFQDLNFNITNIKNNSENENNILLTIEILDNNNHSVVIETNTNINFANEIDSKKNYLSLFNDFFIQGFLAKSDKLITLGTPTQIAPNNNLLANTNNNQQPQWTINDFNINSNSWVKEIKDQKNAFLCNLQDDKTLMNLNNDIKNSLFLDGYLQIEAFDTRSVLDFIQTKNIFNNFEVYDFGNKTKEFYDAFNLNNASITIEQKVGNITSLLASIKKINWTPILLSVRLKNDTSSTNVKYIITFQNIYSGESATSLIKNAPKLNLLLKSFSNSDKWWLSNKKTFEEIKTMINQEGLTSVFEFSQNPPVMFEYKIDNVTLPTQIDANSFATAKVTIKFSQEYSDYGNQTVSYETKIPLTSNLFLTPQIKELDNIVNQVVIANNWKNSPSNTLNAFCPTLTLLPNKTYNDVINELNTLQGGIIKKGMSLTSCSITFPSLVNDPNNLIAYKIVNPILMSNDKLILNLLVVNANYPDVVATMMGENKLSNGEVTYEYTISPKIQ